MTLNLSKQFRPFDYSHRTIAPGEQEPFHVVGRHAFVYRCRDDATNLPTEILIAPDNPTNYQPVPESMYFDVPDEANDFTILWLKNKGNDPVTVRIYAGRGRIGTNETVMAAPITFAPGVTLPVDVQNVVSVAQNGAPWQVEIAGSAGGLAIDWSSYPGWDGSGVVDVNLVSPDPLPVAIEGFVQNANGDIALNVVQAEQNTDPVRHVTEVVTIPGGHNGSAGLTIQVGREYIGLEILLLDVGSATATDLINFRTLEVNGEGSDILIPMAVNVSYVIDDHMGEYGALMVSNPSPDPVKFLVTHRHRAGANAGWVSIP